MCFIIGSVRPKATVNTKYKVVMNTIFSLNLIKVLNGTLSIGHRPKIKTLADYKQRGVSHIVTLLSDKEGALDIKKAVYDNDLQWLWLPLENAQPPCLDRNDEIVETFNKWKTLLNEQAHFYIHCSAGIHRTGMIAYAFLRYLGLNVPEATRQLEQMRLTTAENVGHHRLTWGDRLALASTKLSFGSKLDEFLQHNYIGCIFYAHSVGGGYQYRGKIEKVCEDGSVSLCNVETTSNEDYDDQFIDPFSIPGNWIPYDNFDYSSTDLDIEISSYGVEIHYLHAGVLYIHNKPCEKKSWHTDI